MAEKVEGVRVSAEGAAAAKAALAAMGAAGDRELRGGETEVEMVARLTAAGAPPERILLVREGYALAREHLPADGAVEIGGDAVEGPGRIVGAMVGRRVGGDRRM